MKILNGLFVIGTLVGMGGCQSGRYSGTGFRLPPGGDAERGRAAFVSHQCHTCHAVQGADLPAPSIRPAVPVVLGGTVSYPKTDGYLVTSIIYPTYQLAGYPKDLVTVEGRSRMPSHAGSLTVSEVADIVEFLQAHYDVREVQPYVHY